MEKKKIGAVTWTVSNQINQTSFKLLNWNPRALHTHSPHNSCAT